MGSLKTLPRDLAAVGETLKEKLDLVSGITRNPKTDPPDAEDVTWMGTEEVKEEREEQEGEPGVRETSQVDDNVSGRT